MDPRLRQLERLAAAGDIAAARTLIETLLRLGNMDALEAVTGTEYARISPQSGDIRMSTRRSADMRDGRGRVDPDAILNEGVGVQALRQDPGLAVAVHQALQTAEVEPDPVDARSPGRYQGELRLVEYLDSAADHEEWATNEYADWSVALGSVSSRSAFQAFQDGELSFDEYRFLILFPWYVVRYSGSGFITFGHYPDEADARAAYELMANELLARECEACTNNVEDPDEELCPECLAAMCEQCDRVIDEAGHDDDCPYGRAESIARVDVYRAVDTGSWCYAAWGDSGGLREFDHGGVLDADNESDAVIEVSGLFPNAEVHVEEGSA